MDPPSGKIGTVGKHTVDRGLTAQLLEHLGSTSQSVTRLANGDVEDELLNAQLPHGVAGLVLVFTLFMSAVSGPSGRFARVSVSSDTWRSRCVPLCMIWRV